MGLTFKSIKLTENAKSWLGKLINDIYNIFRTSWVENVILFLKRKGNMIFGHKSQALSRSFNGHQRWACNRYILLRSLLKFGLVKSKREAYLMRVNTLIIISWLRSANLYFCATDFYLANGIPKWIFLLHGCRTNQINIHSPMGGSVKPFFGTFLLCFNFLDFLIFLSHGMNSKMDFPLAQIWSLSISTDTKDELHR